MFKTHQKADCCSGLRMWNLLYLGSGSADCPEFRILNPTNSQYQMVQQRGKRGFWNVERKSRPCSCWSWYSCLDGWTVHLTYAPSQYFPASQKPPRVSYICQMLCCSFSATNMGDCVKKNTARTPTQRCCRFTQYCTTGGDVNTLQIHTKGQIPPAPFVSAGLAHFTSISCLLSLSSLASSRFVKCVKEMKQTQAYPFGDASLHQVKQCNSLKPFQSCLLSLKSNCINCKVQALISCSLYRIL